jgi:hypothetical protein
MIAKYLRWVAVAAFAVGVGLLVGCSESGNLPTGGGDNGNYDTYYGSVDGYVYVNGQPENGVHIVLEQKNIIDEPPYVYWWQVSDEVVTPAGAPSGEPPPNGYFYLEPNYYIGGSTVRLRLWNGTYSKTTYSWVWEDGQHYRKYIHLDQ